MPTLLPLTGSVLSIAASTNILLLVMLVIGFLVAAAVIILALRALTSHAQAPADAGNERVPLLWSAIIGIIVLALFAGSTILYLKSVSEPENSEDVIVVAKNWMWKFQHAPDGKAEIDELHVPVGKAVRLIMTSQDSTHSIFIPRLQQQQDILHGQFTAMILQLDKAGEYPFFTAQYSGAGYTDMAGKIIAMAPEDYQAWLTGQTTSPPQSGEGGEAGAGGLAAEGEAIFAGNGCSGCHADADSPVAPTLHNIVGNEISLADGSTVTVDDAYLHESIVDAGAKVVKGYNDIMPKNYGADLSPEQIEALIAYINSLSGIEGTSDESSSAEPSGSTDALTPEAQLIYDSNG